MRSFISLSAAVGVLLMSVFPVSADWMYNGNPVCTAPNWQLLAVVVSDGNHGAIIAWEDNRSGLYDVYAQRIDENGFIKWAYNGVAVCTASGDQADLSATEDGEGGIIITWHDGRGADKDIYAQRMNSLGSVLWTANGVAVCAASGNQEIPSITSDGAGGAIITWQDSRGGNGGVYAQRISANGNVMWAANGVPACSISGECIRADIVSDGSGGAIIAWHDNRAGEYDMYAQRVRSDGTVLWTLNGVEVCTAPGRQGVENRNNITTDGMGGAIITWEDNRGADTDVYAQRVDSLGNTVWTTNGAPICTASGDQEAPMNTSDGAGGVIISWSDHRGPDFDIFTQRIDANGDVQWTTDGVAICTEIWDQSNRVPVSDGAGGAIFAWRDSRANPLTSNIYAQKVNASGAVLWQHQGVPICTAINTQSLKSSTTDGAGGAIIAWYDYRDENYDVYAYRINPDYVPPGAEPSIVAVQDVPNDQGGKICIQWERSSLDQYPQTDLSFYSIWRRLTKAQADQLGLLPDSTSARGSATKGDGQVRHIQRYDYAWEWLENVPAGYFETYALTVMSLYDSTAANTGWQYFMVRAQTHVQNIFYDSAIDSGYSVDNLSPCTPTSFAGRMISPPPGLLLSWDPNGEEDLKHYAVYRGLSIDFVPGPGNLLFETTNTSGVDSEWSLGDLFYYKLSALDVHGNESGRALLVPDDIIATMLENFFVTVEGRVVEIKWQLSETSSEMEFFVLKKEDLEKEFLEIQDPEIWRENVLFTFRDLDISPGSVYRYRIDVADEAGRRILFETEDIQTPALELTLYQNFPNPFYPPTSIRYYLPEEGTVTLDIFDVSGRKVRSLVGRPHNIGFHYAEWDGLDNQGNAVSSGIYMYVLKTGGTVLSRKMILIR